MLSESAGKGTRLFVFAAVRGTAEPVPEDADYFSRTTFRLAERPPHSNR